VIVADEDVVVDRSETLHGGIVDRHGTRVAGALLASIGTPLGIGAVVLGAVLATNPQSQAPLPLFLGGGAVAVGSLIVGLVLATQHDYVTLELQPGVAALAPGPALLSRRETTDAAHGLTATLRF
jgi:hypothetical protein